MITPLRLALAGLLIVGTAGFTVAAPQVASAAPGQVGAPQVTLNPGGGVAADGSDGIRFTVNAASDPAHDFAQPGQDVIRFRNTNQYCCGAGAPMLNIGGQLYGQASAANWTTTAPSWSSITVLSTSGSTAQRALTSTTGNASATLRYVATHGGLDYVMDRTLAYTFPNESVVETYEFTIPLGNTVPVKFYQGGDAAPGGSDSGYGVMLTSPVRSVISLNTSSGIQFAFSEVSGSKPFDGATSQHYSAPYDAIIAGGDIGFVATAAIHDAGLMMQWNLGSTPGTQTASMRTFANTQATNLTAGFDREFTTSGVPVDLDMSVVNTILTPVTGVGFTIALPAGTVVASGAQANTCGGTLTATPGTTSVTLADGSVGEVTNCVASVPVVAGDYGTYTLTRDSVTSITNATNNVGTTSFFVPLPPAWTQTELGDLTVGTPSTSVVDADGEPAPTYALTAGALPAGLALESDTGAVTGTPTIAGAYSVTVTATNSGGEASQTFSGAVARGLPPLGGTATPGTVAYGSAVTLEATSLPTSATGTVTFTSGGTTLCSVTLPTTSCTTATTLTPGDYPVQTTYSGDANWEPRTLATAGFTVTQATSTLTADLSDDATTFGTPVSVETSVTPADAAGTVTISAGGATLCTVTLPDTSCSTPDDLAPSTYTVVAAYSGEARYTSATAEAGTLTVSRATPAPTPENPVSTYGTAAELTLPGLPDDATGTVSFTSGGEVLCSYELATGTSCEAPADLPAGTYALVVAYSGDANYEPVEAAAELTVERAASSVSTDAVTTTFGDPVDLAVTGIPDAATGTVTISSGVEVLCTIDVAVTSSCEISGTLSAGSYDLLVSYEGDGNHLGSDTTTTLDVAQVVTSISAAPVSTTVGESVTFIVDGLPEAAAGTVTIGNDELGQLCSFQVAAATSCTTDGTTPVGSYEIVVAYGGDENHAADETTTTMDVVQIVTAISAAPVSTTFGTPVTITVEGLPEGATGTVTIGNDELGQLCSFQVAAATSCTTDGTTPVGSHELLVAYGGDANHEGAQTDVTLLVDLVPVTLVLTAEPDPAVAGQPVTLRAVIGGGGDVGGTVSFSIEGSAIPGCDAVAVVDGEATCATTLPEGTYAITAIYGGDGEAAPATSQVLSVVVVAAPVQAAPVRDISAAPSVSSLPETGFPATSVLLPGSFLMAAGALLVLASRRRRAIA